MGRHGENIRKRGDGRWEARYTAYDEAKGEKVCHSVYGHTYEEAKAKRAAALRAAALPSKEKNVSTQRVDIFSDISFGTAAKEWLDAMQSGQKPSTCEKYRFIYRNYIENLLGNVPLMQITDSLVKERLMSCEAASDSLWKSIYCVLNGILRFASERYRMPLPEIRKAPSAVRRKETAAFSKSEQAKLLSAVNTNMDRFKMAVLLCLFTGLRLGELCALKWADIDFLNKTLTVKRTVQRLYTENDGRKTALVETSPKSVCSRREIPLQDAVAALLMNYKNGQEYIFGGDKPLDPRTMQNHYKKILDEAGVSYKNFHTLRHTYATNCIEGGADVKSLSEMLGHSNVKVTMNYYVHPSMDTKRIYADSLYQFYIRIHGRILGRAG